MVAIDELSSTGMTAQDTRSPADDIVTGCRVLGSADHGDPVWGHVSRRDPGSRGVWLKAGGSSFKEQGAPELRFYTRLKTAAVRYAW
jgi:hypothetical protein